MKGRFGLDVQKKPTTNMAFWHSGLCPLSWRLETGKMAWLHRKHSTLTGLGPLAYQKSRIRTMAFGQAKFIMIHSVALDPNISLLDFQAARQSCVCW